MKFEHAEWQEWGNSEGRLSLALLSFIHVFFSILDKTQRLELFCGECPLLEMLYFHLFFYVLRLSLDRLYLIYIQNVCFFFNI